ncbi:F-box protein CPR1-like [Mercurialis annua]|uniref:F-box protein CPR1-like n=1 Tax=Mercurialis annua TaxID=3986 RepID=UPI00215FBDA0|nr:F-box protein CPR1-like [Mercurialis annua]
MDSYYIYSLPGFTTKPTVTMSDQILPETVSNILSRCDVATIGRCKCISKQWRDIIESTHFMKLHLDYATNTSSAAVFFKELFDEALFQASMKHLDSRYVPITSQVMPFVLIGSCNGLLLLHKKQTQDFCIVNPATDKHAYLPHLLPTCNDDAAIGYGFGYDSVNDDYKVIRIAQESGPGKTGFFRTEITVTCVKKRAIELDEMPYFMKPLANGLFLAGALHWLMCRYDHKNMLLIVGYDLATNETRELPLPDLKGELKDFKFEDCVVGLGILRTWLSISTNYGNGMTVGFWAMKEYGVEESWSKLFSFSLAHMSCALVRPLGLSNSDNLVVLELDRTRLILYDRMAKDVTGLEHKAFGEAMVCFRSIAPLPSAENGQTDENNQSSQDQNRSTRKKRDDFLWKGFKLISWSWMVNRVSTCVMKFFWWNRRN